MGLLGIALMAVYVTAVPGIDYSAMSCHSLIGIKVRPIYAGSPSATSSGLAAVEGAFSAALFALVVQDPSHLPQTIDTLAVRSGCALVYWVTGDAVPLTRITDSY